LLQIQRLLVFARESADVHYQIERSPYGFSFLVEFELSRVTVEELFAR